MELANDLAIPFVDLDLEIEKHTKQKIPDIFSEKGEAHFRQLEKLHLNALIKKLPTFVMATGGGTPCFFDNMEMMKSSGKTVFINTPIHTIKKRLQHDTIRPLMQTTTLENLLEKRESYYLQADLRADSLGMLTSLFKNSGQNLL